MNHLHPTRTRNLVFCCLIPAMIFLASGCGETPPPATTQKEVTICRGIANPGPMALDRRGNLYMIDRANGRIEVIMADGMKTPLAEGLNQPADLVVNSRGDILVSETGAGTIRCIHPDGTQTVMADGLDAPTGLTLDRDGGIYVACKGNGQILKISRQVLNRAAEITTMR